MTKSVQVVPMALSLDITSRTQVEAVSLKPCLIGLTVFRESVAMSTQNALLPSAFPSQQHMIVFTGLILTLIYGSMDT